MGRDALPAQQANLAETVESRDESPLRLAYHFSQQFMRELSPYGSSDLAYLLGRRADPVEPRHQRSMQACRDRKRWRRNYANRPLSRALAFGFHHRLRHFLHEQWNTVTALDDVLPNACREKLVADDAVNHGADFALCQPIDGNGEI